MRPKNPIFAHLILVVLLSSFLLHYVSAQAPIRVECPIEFCFIHVFGKDSFDPQEIMVRPGANITWIIHVTEPFTITSGNGKNDPNSGKLFDSGVIRLPFNSTYSFRFKELGEFPFHSKFNPGYVGKVIVRGEPFPAPQPVKIEPPKPPAEQARNVPPPLKQVPIVATKPTQYIVEYSLPNQKSTPVAIAADASGNVWSVHWNTSTLAVLFPANNTLKEFKIPANKVPIEVWSLLIDSRGLLWFADAQENLVWRFSPDNETFQRYLIPTKDAKPLQLAADKEGNLWLTETAVGKIAKVNVDKVVAGTSAGIQEYPLQASNVGPAGLTISRDGAIWITEAFARKLAKFDPISLRLDIFDIQVPLYSPLGIAADSAGMIWVCDHGSNRIIRLDPYTNSVKEYSTSQAAGFPVSLPYWILVDKESNIWFNEHSGGRIARFYPRTETMIEYIVPKGESAGILQLALDRTGNVWFSESVFGRLGMIDSSIIPSLGLQLSSNNLKSQGESVNLTVTVVSQNPVKSQSSLGLMYAQSITGKVDKIQILQSKIRDGQPRVSVLTLIPEREFPNGKHSFTVSFSDGEVISSAAFVLDLVRQEQDKPRPREVAAPRNPLPQEPEKEQPEIKANSPPANHAEPSQTAISLLTVIPVAVAIAGVILFRISRNNKNS